jgi:hypothetical protein
LFIKNLGVSEGDIRCIPCHEEKYISFSKFTAVNRIVRTDHGEKEVRVCHELRFLDSYKFMASGLGSLADNLESKECENLRKSYDNTDEFELLKRKGVYPYDHVD